MQYEIKQEEKFRFIEEGEGEPLLLLHGLFGALSNFGGQIEHAEPGGDWQPVVTQHAYADGNYRILGVADMAHAIRENRPHRASGELAFHVLEVMEAFNRSSQTGRFVSIESRPERPAPLDVRGL